MIADMPEDVYVLTNTSGIDGAAEILQEEIRHKIADTIGDFFVLPSSLHEVIIIPKSNRDTPEELACIVQEVNETQVSPEERLSNHIYEYSSSEQNYKRVSLKAAS
jgi:UDP-3-O-acyl-N-acetylglucosamine deacetylase